MNLWKVWWVQYATYADIAQHGEMPSRCVSGPLPLEKALDLVKQLGFGHSVQPLDKQFRKVFT